MSIGFYNFAELHNPDFQQKVLQVYTEILKENAFIEGKYNALFEGAFGKLQGAKHALLLSNGTDALEIALLAYGVRPGEKVGITGITFWATAEAVINIGAVPVMIDVDPITGLMCTQSLKRTLERHKLKAIMPVHIYGLPAPMAEIEKICSPLGVKIVEDGAQAQGTFFAPQKPVGSGNNLTTFSFYPTKNLGAFGDAGALLTQDDELAQKIKLIRNHGRGAGGRFEVVGRNARCDHLQAAVLYLKLEKIEAQNKKRKTIAERYLKKLSTFPLRLVPEQYVGLSSWHLFPVGLKDQNQKYRLFEHLKGQQISSMLFYERSMADELPLKKYEGENESAQHFADTTLCLPIHPFLTDHEQDQVVEAIRNFLQQ